MTSPRKPVSSSGSSLFTLHSSLLWLSSCPSTNDVAWTEGRAREADLLVVAADVQTAGRGRHGRAWHGAPGKDLLFSIYLRPAKAIAPAGVVTALGAVAVCQALESASRFAPHASLRIHWPNDLYVGRRKLCGILAEHRSDGATPDYVIGVGLNVNSLPEDRPEEIQDLATSLRAETGREWDRRELLDRILDRFSFFYPDGLARLEGAWRERSGLAGARVRLELGPGRTAEGKVLEAGLDGIALSTPAGTVRFPAEHVLRAVPLD